ncbi:MAG: M3 family metallopeptidase, partial [bacterium]
MSDESKAKLREINQELSLLSVHFGENVLKENNRFELILDSEENLAGLPDPVVNAARQTAKKRGHDNKWAFTLHKPSLIPFLQYCEKRDLRERIFTAYTSRGSNGNDLDNNKIVSRIVELRSSKARLLGHKSYAEYVLEERMAGTPEKVYELLDQLWKPSLSVVEREAKMLQDMIDQEGRNYRLEPWDWWFYAEKLRRERFDLDEEALRPYFQLENVRDGAFAVAGRLFGLTFEERPDLPVYHPDVQAFEVREADSSHVGILYLDYFPRASKEGGAWMNSYRKQRRDVSPVISNVCNFSKPTEKRPALLSFGEVSTLFHEFGHALHGLLSDCTYESLSGTDVAWDFVELPSQIMENWASEPEVLRMYARHFETGETIPDDLIAKL